LKILSNLDKDSCDVTNNNVKDLDHDKPLYNSFFKEISKDQSKSQIKLVQERKNNDKVKGEDIFLENQRLIDLANLKNDTENMRNRIDEMIKSGTKKQEEIKSMEKK